MIINYTKDLPFDDFCKLVDLHPETVLKYIKEANKFNLDNDLCLKKIDGIKRGLIDFDLASYIVNRYYDEGVRNGLFIDHFLWILKRYGKLSVKSLKSFKIGECIYLYNNIKLTCIAKGVDGEPCKIFKSDWPLKIYKVLDKSTVGYYYGKYNIIPEKLIPLCEYNKYDYNEDEFEIFEVNDDEYEENGIMLDYFIKKIGEYKHLKQIIDDFEKDKEKQCDAVGGDTSEKKIKLKKLISIMKKYPKNISFSGPVEHCKHCGGELLRIGYNAGELEEYSLNYIITTYMICPKCKKEIQVDVDDKLIV